jgi:hypothetical protein
MARETSYFVQPFNAGKGGNLKPDAPIACKTANGALRTAERLALSKLGVVAFSSTGDPEMATMTTSPRSFSAMAGCRRPSIEISDAVPITAQRRRAE